MSAFCLKYSYSALGQLLLLVAFAGLLQAEENERANATKLAPLAPFEKYTPEDRSRWAYQPPKRPEVPKVGKVAWVKTPVDAFVLARLEKEGLMPARPADRATLLRRVTFDLTGLPPSPEEIDTFIKDPSPKAYASVVERRFQLALWRALGATLAGCGRYADTDGVRVRRAEA
jgi:hypothetical protein